MTVGDGALRLGSSSFSSLVAVTRPLKAFLSSPDEVPRIRILKNSIYRPDADPIEDEDENEKSLAPQRLNEDLRDL